MKTNNTPQENEAHRKEMAVAQDRHATAGKSKITYWYANGMAITIGELTSIIDKIEAGEVSGDLLSYDEQLLEIGGAWELVPD